ncbi:MAG: methyltransferase domain-containing protein [Bacillota bacterium]
MEFVLISGKKEMIVKEAYNNWSGSYDSDINLTRDLDHFIVTETLKGFHCRRILETGCGTGKNTRFLATISEEVLSIDFSEGMLKKAKSKTDRGNVLFALADITRPWPAADNTIDLIVCSLVLEHIEDLSFIFSEAYRVLAKGGIFFICELHPFRQYQGKKARYQKGDETIEIHAFIHNISDFFSAGKDYGLSLADIKEWKHEEDRNILPRLLSLQFVK